MPRRYYGSFGPGFGAGMSRTQRKDALNRPEPGPYHQHFMAFTSILKEALKAEWMDGKGDDAAVRYAYGQVLQQAVELAMFGSANPNDYSGVPRTIEGLRNNFSEASLSSSLDRAIRLSQSSYQPAVRAVPAFQLDHRATFIEWAHAQMEAFVTTLPALPPKGQGGGVAR